MVHILLLTKAERQFCASIYLNTELTGVNTTMDRITSTLIGICLMILSSAASAVAITGTINIGGGSQVYSNGSTSTGINFNCGATCGGSVNMFPPPTGDFSGLGGLSTANSLSLYSFYYSNIPQQKIWDINYKGLLYSFTLTSVQVVSGDSGNFSTLVLAGTGMFDITNSDGSDAGYTGTSGSWVYSQSGASFSSQSSVPEPGTIALLGLGLLGIGVANRIRKSA